MFLHEKKEKKELKKQIFFNAKILYNELYYIYKKEIQRKNK